MFSKKIHPFLMMIGLLLATLSSGCTIRSGEYEYDVPASQMFIFPHWAGPKTKSILPAKETTSWKKYETGNQSRLAILLTDEDSLWLGLAHGFKSIGIPFIITNDYKKALQHKVVFVYPYISGKVLKADALKALGAFPRNGGTLIASNVYGGGLQETFGFKELVSADGETEIHFQKSPLTTIFTDPHEKTIRLGKTFETSTYTDAKSALATYRDGKAVITQKDFAEGHAYALGIDLGQYFLKGYNNRQEDIARVFHNDYEPHIDTLLRLLKNIYTQGEPNAVTINTVPDNKSLAVIITHDVDFTRSIKNSVAYARYEKSQNIPATYFIQTKYIRDYNDDIFFNQEGVAYLKQIAAMGMEIGSHTIAHSKVFSKFPMGIGSEQYPKYQPFVKDSHVAYNASILGELRVSKFLLESAIPGQQVVSFRPGELSYPFTLPEALAATGFLYSSNTTADNALTHLPYQLNYSRGNNAEMEQFEFPVTIEDEALPPLGERVPQAVALAEKLKKYGGLFVILIHPNITGHKLSFEQQFVSAIKPYAYFGDMRTFGAWWANRNKIGIDVIPGKTNEMQVIITAPKAIQGLTLNIPKDWQYLSGKPATLQARQTQQTITVNLQPRQNILSFKK